MSALPEGSESGRYASRKADEVAGATSGAAGRLPADDPDEEPDAASAALSARFGRLRAAPARFWLPFALVVLLGGLLRFAWLGADPSLLLSTSNAEVMDGPWYLAEAVDGARALPTDVPSPYRRPVLTLAGRAFFAAWGRPSLEAAHAFSAAWGVLLVIAGGIAARVAFGRRTGVLAALFLAVSFVLVGYGRAPLVYGPLAASLAVVFLLFTAGVHARAKGTRLAMPAIAAGLALLLAVGMKDAAVAILPALAVGFVVASPSRGKALALVTVAALLGAAAVYAGAQAYTPLAERVNGAIGNVRSYMGSDGAGADPLAIVKRVANAPLASGLATREPMLLGVAWLGVLCALVGARSLAEREVDPVMHPAAEAERRQALAIEAALATWLVTAVLLFAPFRFEPREGGPPLRHFAQALVPAALLAARALDRLRAGVLIPVRAGKLLLTFLWGTAGGYVAVSVLWTAVLRLSPTAPGAPSPWFTSFFAILAVAVLLGALASLCVVLAGRRRSPVSLGSGAFGLLFGALLVAEAAWHIPALFGTRFTLAEANAKVADLLTPASSIEGPFAHMLTWDLPAVRHYVPEMQVADPTAGRRGFTHLAADAAWSPALEETFAKAGRPLTPILRLEVRGYPIVLYRYAWAPVGPREPASAVPPRAPSPAPRSR